MLSPITGNRYVLPGRRVSSAVPGSSWRIPDEFADVSHEQKRKVTSKNKEVNYIVRNIKSAVNFPKRKNKIVPRPVSAFTPSSMMKNAVVKAPPKIGIFKPRPPAPTTFRKMYDRGDIPVTLHHDHRGYTLRWKIDLEKLDYHHFLPLFFDGLRELTHPYDFFSRAGVRDLLSRGGDRILAVVPQLILPLKSALNTRNPKIICTVLHVMQELVLSANHIGEALLPYYRQLLPTLNLFKHWNRNLGDSIDYSQRRQQNLGDLIQDTLELFERKGGKDAYINIRYMVPTYQSCLLN